MKYHHGSIEKGGAGQHVRTDGTRLQDIRRLPRLERRELRRGKGAAGGAARAERQREDHDIENDSGTGHAGFRGHSDQRHACQRYSGKQARDRLRVPELRAVPLHDGCGQHRLRAGSAEEGQEGDQNQGGRTSGTDLHAGSGEALPAPAVGRAAPARGICARTGAEPAAPPAGICLFPAVVGCV